MNRLVKLDARGRVTVAGALSKEGVAPAELYYLDVAPDGIVTLTPADVAPKGAAS